MLVEMLMIQIINEKFSVIWQNFISRNYKEEKNKAASIKIKMIVLIW